MRRMFSLKQLQEIADSEVKSLVEGGTLENAKPIYCHPCTILTDITSGEYAGRKYYLTCLIFNNNSTAFTLATFKDYVNELCENYDARIMTSGGLYDPISEKTTIATAMIWNGEQVVIQGMESNNINSFGLATLTNGNTTFTDGVNKIN